MPAYKLSYFNVRGCVLGPGAVAGLCRKVVGGGTCLTLCQPALSLGECCRYLFHIAGVEFEDHRCVEQLRFHGGLTPGSTFAP